MGPDCRKKGPDEVCSALYLFMMDKIKDNATEFRFYSDNCAGQNRNRFVFGFYSYIAKKFNVTITHTFLEKGHTENEGDSVHSVIEKKKRKSVVYVPSEWYTLIRNAKKSGKPYNVIKIDQTNVFDFKIFVSVAQWNKNQKNQKVPWN